MDRATVKLITAKSRKRVCTHIFNHFSNPRGITVPLHPAMNTLLSRTLGRSIPCEYRYRADYSSAMQLCIHRGVPLLRTLLQPISRQEPYVLTKAASWTYLAFSTYIESWACRMLRRPPRIKQIKTSGTRGA